MCNVVIALIRFMMVLTTMRSFSKCIQWSNIHVELEVLTITPHTLAGNRLIDHMNNYRYRVL